MTPILGLLIYKTWTGVKWILRKFARPAMQTFYQVSWAWYTAYAIQGSFLLNFTWDIFNDEIRGLTLYTILVTVPLWLWLMFAVRWEDRQARSMNSVRKTAKREAIARLTQSNLDRELINSFYTRQVSQGSSVSSA